MSVEFDRGSLGKFDSRTLNRTTLSRWTGRTCGRIGVCACLHARPCTPMHVRATGKCSSHVNNIVGAYRCMPAHPDPSHGIVWHDLGVTTCLMLLV